MKLENSFLVSNPLPAGANFKETGLVMFIAFPKRALGTRSEPWALGTRSEPWALGTRSEPWALGTRSEPCKV